MRRRTSADGDLSSRKRRTDLRSSSCSSLKAKVTGLGPPRTAGRLELWAAQCLLDRAVNLHSELLHYEDSQAEIHKLVVGPMDNNVFILRCKQTGDSVLLDAANEHEKLLPLCQQLNVRRVLETHGHWDHIQAVPAVRDAGYEVGVTALAAPQLKDVGYDVFAG